MRAIGEQGLLASTIYTEESLKPIFYTYVHYRSDSNEPFYVGKGKNKRAFSKHSRSKHWNNIVKKHGFTVKIFASQMIEEDAFIEEMKLIYHFKRAGFQLVNQTNGGEGNTSHRSAEWRKNHSLKIKAAAGRGAYKNRDFCGSKNPFWGKTHTTEQRLKWSKLRNPNVKKNQ